MEAMVGFTGPNIVPYADKGLKDPDYLGSISVAEALGEPHDAVEGLSFDTAKVFGWDTEGESGQPVLELRFDGQPLHGERFLNLLVAIAPGPKYFIRPTEEAGFILNDWVVYESPDERMQALARAHSGLKAWGQLGKEYLDIKTALEPAEGFRLLPWMLLPGNEHIVRLVRPAEWIEDWGPAEHLGEYAPLITGPELVKLLADIYGVDEALSRIVEAMRHIEPTKAGAEVLEGVDLKSETDDKLLGIFNELAIETRNKLVSVHGIQGTYHPDGGHSWGLSDKTEKFNALYLERHCVSFETKDGQLMYAHGITPGFDIQQAYAERQRVYAGNDRPLMHPLDRGLAHEYEMMVVQTVVGQQMVIIPGTVKFQETGLIPTVRWTLAADGKRTPQHLPEHEPFSSYKQDVLSNVAGYMVLAYLQSEKRGRWPRKAKLPGLKDAVQEMGPAQVPLIALQHTGSLLENELMRQAEALV